MVAVRQLSVKVQIKWMLINLGTLTVINNEKTTGRIVAYINGNIHKKRVLS